MFLFKAIALCKSEAYAVNYYLIVCAFLWCVGMRLKSNRYWKQNECKSWNINDWLNLLSHMIILSKFQICYIKQIYWIWNVAFQPKQYLLLSQLRVITCRNQTLHYSFTIQWRSSHSHKQENQTLQITMKIKPFR